MGKQDVNEQKFIRFPDVAADVINVKLYGGRQVVREEDLELAEEYSYVIGAEGELHDRRRDAMFRNRQNGSVYAFVGLENSSDCDRTMPLRVMGYDYGAYIKQVEDFCDSNDKNGNSAYAKVLQEGQRLVPVITIVLYYGKAWVGPKSLQEMIDFTGKESLKQFVPDVKINLIELGQAGIPECFRSDMRIISRYISLKGNREGMRAFGKERHNKIRHAVEVLDVLAALGKNHTYTEIKRKFLEEKRKKEEMGQETEGIRMCDFADVFIEEGKEEGLKEGIRIFILDNMEEGRSQKAIIGKLMRRFGLDARQAAQYYEKYSNAEYMPV